MTGSRFRTDLRCRCGSRQFHVLDYGRGEHLLTCESRLHETPAGPAAIPAPGDFLCPCGGLHVATRSGVAIPGPDGEPYFILKDFACPLCWIVVRIVASPRDPDLSLRAIESATALLRDADRARAERALALSSELLGRRPRRSGLVALLRRLLFGLGDYVPPGPDDPLVRQARELFRELRGPSS